MKRNKKLIVSAAEDYSVFLQLRTNSGLPLTNISSIDAYFVTRRAEGVVVGQKVSQSSSAAGADWDSGKVLIQFTSAQTALLPAGRYFLRLDCVTQAGKTKKYIDERVEFEVWSEATPVSQNFSATFIDNLTTDRNLSVSDRVILVDAFLEDIDLTLPLSSPSLSNSTKGIIYTIKKTDGTTNVINIISQSPDLIDGQTTFTIRDEFDSVNIINDGSNWHLI